jgi:hypothetical protein
MVPDPVLPAPEDLARRLRAVDPLAAAEPGRILTVHAPGRVNLIGEHTDYNDGLVLPAAIDRGISIALVPTTDRRVELTRLDDGELAAVELDAIEPAAGRWIDYVAGTAWAMTEAGLPTTGFHGVLASDLPVGAGLSSSAALELAAAWALSAGERPATDAMTLARLAQRAENEFVGVACGLMDQFAVSFGRADHTVLLDCRSLEHRAVPLPAPRVTAPWRRSGRSIRGCGRCATRPPSSSRPPATGSTRRRFGSLATWSPRMTGSWPRSTPWRPAISRRSGRRCTPATARCATTSG